MVRIFRGMAEILSIDEIKKLMDRPAGFIAAASTIARQYILLHEENERLRNALIEIPPLLERIANHAHEDDLQLVDRTIGYILTTVKEALKAEEDKANG